MLACAPYTCVRLCTPSAHAMYASGRKTKFSARFVGFCTPLHSSYAFVRLRAPACTCVHLLLEKFTILKLQAHIAGVRGVRRRTQAYKGAI